MMENVQASMAIAKENIMKIDPLVFRVKPGEKVQLAHWPTRVKDYDKSKEQYKEILGVHIEDLSRLQGLLYGENR